MVTFLFTDIEGSTKLWEQYPETMRLALACHDALLRDAIEQRNGQVFKTIGDAFCAVFQTPSEALTAVSIAQQALHKQDWNAFAQTLPVDATPFPGIHVRMALHTGEAEQRDNDYFGPTLNRVARLLALGHGGQVLLSRATYDSLQETVPEKVSLRDMGSHRLRDLQQPEHVFQLYHPELPSEFPPLRSEHAVLSNLPQQMTSFVGREQDVAAVRQLVETRRLVTLTGMGGSGKTRLSLKVAGDILEAGGWNVWMVELELARDTGTMLATLALALNIEIATSGDLRRQIIEFLRPKKALLVLDNFEQVVEAAPVVNDLLRECPQLTCLVSSREILRVSGEQEYPVAPLSIPPEKPDRDWSTYESVRLFVERCRAFKPDFAITTETAPVVGELCRRLDGLPLAIELAAARIRGMTPAQILLRLSRRLGLLASTQRDLPDRQRTIRGAIDWSYELLNEDERALFAEMAVFSRGFFLEAAEEVCVTFGAFDAVFSLCDKSLLRSEELAGESRYTMLESVRDYALEKLLQSEVHRELRDRHAEYYLHKAQEWSDQLNGASGAEAMERLRVEIANIREGMDWMVQQDSQQNVIAYGKALFTFLRRRGLYEECDMRLTLAQDAARRSGDRVAEARLLNQRGLLAWDCSELDQARDLFTLSYDISNELGDKTRMLVTGINLGNIAWGRAAFDEARTRWEPCLELAVSTNQPRYEGVLRTSLGILACYQGRYAESESYFETARSIQEGIGNTEGVAYALCNSSELLRRQHKYQQALVRLEESLEIFTTLEHTQGIAETVVDMARNYLLLDRMEEARMAVERGYRTACEINDRRQQMYALDISARIHLRTNEWEKAHRLCGKAFAMAGDVGDRKHMMVTLHLYSEILWQSGEHEKGYKLLAAVFREFGSLVYDDAMEMESELVQWRATPGLPTEEIDNETATQGLDQIVAELALVPLEEE